MPRGDGTGPKGQGPMTGRGMRGTGMGTGRGAGIGRATGTGRIGRMGEQEQDQDLMASVFVHLAEQLRHIR
jgi:hypothetical protein